MRPKGHKTRIQITMQLLSALFSHTNSEIVLKRLATSKVLFLDYKDYGS